MKNLLFIITIFFGACNHSNIAKWEQEIKEINREISIIQNQKIEANSTYMKISEYDQDDLTEEGKVIQADLLKRMLEMKAKEDSLEARCDSIQSLIDCQ